MLTVLSHLASTISVKLKALCSIGACRELLDLNTETHVQFIFTRIVQRKGVARGLGGGKLLAFWERTTVLRDNLSETVPACDVKVTWDNVMLMYQGVPVTCKGLGQE